MGKGRAEKLLASFCIGGIPGYLKVVRDEPSVLLSLAKHAFRKDSLFLEEYDKVFVSSLSNSKYYKAIIETVARQKFLTRKELVHRLSHKTERGDSFTRILEELQHCGFIEGYTPIHLNDGHHLTRYRINDKYLWFYYNFIKPQAKKIRTGRYDDNPIAALSDRKLR